MNIEYTGKFKKNFRKRISVNKNLIDLFEIKLEKFIENPFLPELKTHKLSGRLKGFWAFSVAHDCRVVFSFEDNNKTAILSDIGSHDEVY